MTTIKTVTEELTKNNISITWIYSTIPLLTHRLVINILNFGETALTKSTLGWKVKVIALALAKKDGRKPAVCPVTLKTILV